MKRPILGLFTAFIAFACSGSQPGPGDEQDRLRSENAFCTEWARRACTEDVVNACNGDRAGCLETQKGACLATVPVGYSSVNAEDCLDAVADAYDDAELTAEEIDLVSRLGGACSTLIDGGAVEGESCTRSFECNGVDGFVCVIKPDAVTGTCQLPNEVGGGLNCEEESAVCAEDFYCNGANCVVRVEEDEPCTADNMCAATLRCEIATGATEGVCAPRLANREPCTVDEECASGVCLGTAPRRLCVDTVPLTPESSLCDTLT